MMKAFSAAALAIAASVQAADDVSLTVSRAATRELRQAPAEHFTGSVTVEMLSTPSGEQRGSAGLVSFAPGARTAWHTHPLGQTLIVTAGSGLVQRWGGPVEEIRPGDVVHIAPGIKHWHGASPGTPMTHIAIQEAQGGRTVDWLEAVSDDKYPKAQPGLGDGAAPSRAQQLMGGVAPKLAQLTDDVLFGDVWNRSGLSKRDRSLVTVSALIALNRPEQLRSHMSLALQNGLTQEELVETLTHLAFYAGWPSAVSATTVARDVFRDAKR
jgi:4-carboxymuconolactone decarboxylase